MLLACGVLSADAAMGVSAGVPHLVLIGVPSAPRSRFMLPTLHHTAHRPHGRETQQLRRHSPIVFVEKGVPGLDSTRTVLAFCRRGAIFAGSSGG